MKAREVRWLRSICSAFLVVGFTATFTVAQETYSGAATGSMKTLTGLIKWKKALGTIPAGPGRKDAHTDPCSPFFVTVSNQTDEPSQSKFAWFDNRLEWVAREGEYNLCRFEIQVLPNKQLLVRPGLGSMEFFPGRDRTSYLVKLPWIGGETAASSPSAGNDRNFAPGHRFVTLGTKNMFVPFEMTYSQIMEGLVLPSRRW